MKAVSVKGRPWELYDLSTDRTELQDMSKSHPELLTSMKDLWLDVAKDVENAPANLRKPVGQTGSPGKNLRRRKANDCVIQTCEGWLYLPEMDWLACAVSFVRCVLPSSHALPLGQSNPEPSVLQNDGADHATVVARIHVGDHVVNLRVQGSLLPAGGATGELFAACYQSKHSCLIRGNTVVCWCRRQQIVGLGGDTYFARLSCGGDAGRRRWNRADLV